MSYAIPCRPHYLPREVPDEVQAINLFTGCCVARDNWYDLDIERLKSILMKMSPKEIDNLVDQIHNNHAEILSSDIVTTVCSIAYEWTPGHDVCKRDLFVAAFFDILDNRIRRNNSGRNNTGAFNRGISQCMLTIASACADAIRKAYLHLRTDVIALAHFHACARVNEIAGATILKPIIPDIIDILAGSITALRIEGEREACVICFDNPTAVGYFASWARSCRPLCQASNKICVGCHNMLRSCPYCRVVMDDEH